MRKQIGEHWDAKVDGPAGKRRSWWQSELIRSHINRLVSGTSYPGFSEGLRHEVKRRLGNRVFEKGISVGCGIASKEMTLLRAGLVRSFELFELSQARIEKGRQLAKRLHLEDRLVFRREDAFEVTPPSSVDLVHWNNSLHHMLNVERAVAWSYRVLRPKGLFYMDDYVGPARFQWSEESLALATRLRSLLPERYLRNPDYPERGDRILSRRARRPNASRLARQDPSESPQSDRILDAVRRRFPNAEITLTGGLVYHLALGGLIQNFDEEIEEDRTLLRLLLLVDELSIRVPGLENHYATALAWKNREETMDESGQR